jgi:transcriptional regulator with XRE-family HTH domain
MTINANIKEIRSKKKLTQEFVAKKLGVSRVWYNKLENDEIDIKVDLLPKLAEILKVPIHELTQINGSSYFNSHNNGTVKNMANVVNDNQEVKELYEEIIKVKNHLLTEKDLRIKMLEEKLKNFISLNKNGNKN